MPRRLPSSALDAQTQLTASGTGAVLAGTWYIGTGGAGSGGAVAGTLNGPLTGTADYAKQLTPGKALNGTTFTGADAITVPLNTTSITTSGTYYPTFVPSDTAGNQQASTHASLKYDPNTGYLSATRFLGSGAGLTGVVKSISFNGAAAVDGAVSITSPAQVQPDWNATTGLGSILNKPALFSGSYTDLTSKPTLFDGDYNSLSNKPSIPAPAPVTSVNGSTGAVQVRGLYDPGTTYYVLPEYTAHNPLPLGYLASGYVGDYFSSTGFSLTGMSVAGFQSAANIEQESGTIINWVVSFDLEFFQAFFDTYALGYGPDDMRMVNVTMNNPYNYGVSWVGQPSTARWTTNQNTLSTMSYVLNPNLATQVYRARFSFSTDPGITGQIVNVNGRQSPAAWPFRLYLRFWVGK